MAAGAVLCVLYFGIRVYPAAGFFGVLSIDEKQSAAKRLALPCLGCAAAMILTSSFGSPLSVHTLALLVADCFMPTAAFAAITVWYSAIDNFLNISSELYFIAASAIFVLTAAVLISASLDFNARKPWKKRKTPFAVCALFLLPIFAAALYFSSVYRLLLMPLLFYGAPVTLIVFSFLFYNVMRGGFSRLCKIAAALNGLILTVGVCLILINAEIISLIFSVLFMLLCVCSFLLIIYNYRRSNMANTNKVISGLGFHHIALKVKDFEKSYKFYTDLGLTPYASWGEGSGRVQMFDLGDGGILEMFAGATDELAPVGNWQHFAMKCDDVDAAYEKALSVGARPHIPPKDAALDSKPEKMLLHIAFVLGPDDEQLEFFSVKSKG